MTHAIQRDGVVVDGDQHGLFAAAGTRGSRRLALHRL
jgi:hypothetical protein